MSTNHYSLAAGGRSIIRTIVENDGAISAEERLEPSVLPMTSVTLSHLEQQLYLMSTKTRQGAIEKGKHYCLDAITQKGLITVREPGGNIVPGLFPMDYFVEMVNTTVKVAPLPFDPNPGAPIEPVEPTSGQDPKQKGRR